MKAKVFWAITASVPHFNEDAVRYENLVRKTLSWVSGSTWAVLECLNNLPVYSFHLLTEVLSLHLSICAAVHMRACEHGRARVCHLCWHCSPHLPIWQLVIDWLLNAPFTHMRTHTNADRKVHYTSISEPVLIVMEDRCKVLGMYLTYAQKYRQTWRQSVLHTYGKRHKMTLIPFYVDFTRFFPAQISHTHTHTHHRTVQYPFNVLSCCWQQWSEVSLRRVGKKVSCPLH